MRKLDPRSAEDRRITSFTRSFPIKTFPNGDVLQGTYSYDCWGDKQGGLFKQRISGKLSKEITGQKSLLSLKIMQAGCCPPQLASQMMGEQSGKDSRGDPIEEAMLLHKRGYLGGVG